jgi:hypothetical protein
VAPDYAGGTVAQPKSKRRSRKRHRPGAPSQPVAVKRREQAPVRRQASATQGARANPLRAYGPPPPNRFGGVPVSEIAILAGGVGLVVGLVTRNISATVAGIVVCGLGVLEFTVREHFSGYRSHTSLLAAFPAVIIEGILILAIKPRHALLVLPAVVPIYGAAFMFLRRRFLVARQLRLARPQPPQ